MNTENAGFDGDWLTKGGGDAEMNLWKIREKLMIFY